MPTAIPTSRQLEYQDWEFGLFLHFGIRTFYEGHRDWDGKPMPAEGFLPTAFDANNWAATARQAGMKYIVLTAKHHDGFANWPSKYTDYSVAATPWKDGAGDVVAEYVDACRRHDVKVGLYYSPAEASPKFKSDPKEYDDYFIGQVSEILTGYGEIDILWFDGCGSADHTYDWPRIIAEMRRMQPNILLFNMGDPDFRWVGNELGLAPVPCFNTVEDVPFAMDTLVPDKLGKALWLPAECDCRMRERNWFYSDQDEHTVKSVEELMGLYYMSVGRGCNLLINIGPDRRGLLPDADAARLLEFGAEIRRRFGSPVATLADFTEVDGGWEWTPAEPTLVDHVVIQEDLSEGEHIRRFRLTLPFDRVPITLWEGQNVGHKAICRFPQVKAPKLRVESLETDGRVELRTLECHNTVG